MEVVFISIFIATIFAIDHLRVLQFLQKLCAHQHLHIVLLVVIHAVAFEVAPLFHKDFLSLVNTT